MVCRCLATLVVFTVYHATGGTVEEAQGTRLAPKVAQATAEVQGLHPWVELGASGKENSEKAEKECHLVVQASLLSDKRSSFPSETSVTDDVALWKLQYKQRRAPGVLPSVQSTLVHNMEEISQKIEEQECSGKEHLQAGAEQGPGRRRDELEHFPNKCPMGSFHAFRQKCSQEDRDAGWSWTKRAARGAASGDTSRARIFSGDLNCRGGEDLRALERIAEHGNGPSGSSGTAEADFDGKAAVGDWGQVHYTWTYQQAQQVEIPGGSSWTQSTATGPGMGEVCRSYAAKSTSTCSDVPAMQIRPLGGIQPQARGARSAEAGDEFSVSFHAWGNESGDKHSGNAGLDEQIKDISAVISLEGTVGTVDLTSDMEEDDATDHPKASMKGSPKPLKTFRGATSPTKVAQQHLKPRTQDVREMKQKEREAAS